MEDVMVVVDAVAMLWIIVAIVWGVVLGQLIWLAALNWWRVAGWMTAQWAAFPPVVDIRRRRQQEEFNWWWANASPEDIARYRASKEAFAEMTQRLAEAMRDVGMSMDEAVRSMMLFGDPSRNTESG